VPGFNPNFESLVRGMIERRIVQFDEPRVLADGSTSNTYVDLRKLISHPDLYVKATDAYADTLARAEILHRPDGSTRHLAAVPEAVFYHTGAVAYRLATAYGLEAPLLQRRVKPKGHGIQQTMLGLPDEGPLAGTEVVLLDDVIKSSKSKVEEAGRIRELSDGSIAVTGVAVLVDRLQGGRTELGAAGIPDFAAALTLESIARYALDERLGGMTQMLYDDLRSELDPAELAAAGAV
jgi:orotate phosphoribosyltransferase